MALKKGCDMDNYKIIAFLAILFSVQISAAQKCRYEKDEIDAVTELRVKRTEPLEMTKVNERPLLMKTQCIGKHKYLKVRYYRYNSFEISSEKPFEIIFRDESSVKLKAREMPEPQNTGGFVKVSSLLVYNLDKNQYKQLLNKPAVQIKYFIDEGGYVRKDIPEKYQEDIMHLMQCVLLESDDL